MAPIVAEIRFSHGAAKHGKTPAGYLDGGAHDALPEGSPFHEDPAMRTLRRAVELGIAVVVAAHAGAGDVVWAGPEKTLRVPADFPTITKAMAEAAGGDTVLVAPGTYTESVSVKDGVALLSEKGPAETTIAYDTAAKADPQESVITLQSSSNSTQIVGFSIDGRATAKRGILAIGDGEPVIGDCRIFGAANGIGSHRNSAPYIVDTRVESSQIAGIFVQSGSADIRHCDLAGGDKYGLVIEGTTRPVHVRDTKIHDNGQAGVRATDGEFSMKGGSVSGNGNTGLILEYVSPLLEGTLIEGNKNIGAALQNSTGTLLGCTVRNNNFGVVIAGTGDPKIFRTTFEDNPGYHIGLEGEVVPVIGGSLENANLFLGETGAVIQTACATPVVASYNYWGSPCATKDQVKRLAGSKDVIRRPWVTADLKHSFSSCDEARKFSRTPVTGEPEDEEPPPTSGAAAPSGETKPGTGGEPGAPTPASSGTSPAPTP